MKNLAFALLVGFVGLNTPASAAEVWWHQVPANAAQDNGNVTLLDANGNPVNMVVNPTAAAVKANRAAATQPPTVVVQATTGYWKDPVAAVANLPPAGNATGDVRMVMSTAKPYMWNGSKWVEQSSDYSGTIAAGNVLIKNVATEGSSCSPNGLVAATTTGLLLSCQSGIWRAQSSTPIKTWYSADSSGSGNTVSMGNRKYCALTYSWYAWKEQVGGCYVFQSGLTYYLRAQGDPAVAGGKGISCQAACFD